MKSIFGKMDPIVGQAEDARAAEVSEVLPTDLDAQAEQVRQLDASHRFAMEKSPDDAAKTLLYARQAGIDFEAAEKSAPPPQADWGRLVKDHPALAEALADPGFAAVARDDVPRLEGFERLFAGWTDAVDYHRIESEDLLHQELSAIGRAQRYGKATPEMEARAQKIEKLLAQPKKPQGLFSGVVGSMLGMGPAFGRIAETTRVSTEAGALAGALGGSAAGPGGAAAGALAGGAAGFGIGMQLGFAADTANTEQGIAFRDFTRMGASPEAAGAAADIVALANGALMSIPAEKVFNAVPGLQAALAGKPVKDLMRRLIASPSGAAALARLGGRIAESGVTMALISSAQELVREIGAIGAGAAQELPSDKWDRLLGAAASGAELGVGFGVLHGVPKFRADMAEVEAAKNRVSLYQTLGDIAQNSKLRERMPEEFKVYANDVIRRHGTVEEAKAPAEKLMDLFQKEGIDPKQTMPEVARQIEAAIEANDPQREVVIPMADLATHIAGTKSFPELHQDLRIKDDLTPREAVEVEKEVQKQIANGPPKAEESNASTRAVYDDVYAQLTAAGTAPEVAAHDAIIWSAFAQARGARTGVDPLEYYRKRKVQIGAEFQGTPGETTLGQKYKPGEEATFNIKDILLDDQNRQEAEDNIRRGRGSMTEGPVKLYRREGSRKLEVGDGHHRLIEAVQRGETTIRGIVSEDVLPRQKGKKGTTLLQKFDPMEDPEFKARFAGSKVVDESGVPLVLHHGTKAGDFEAFEPGAIGSQSGNVGIFGRGFYFSDDPRIASEYAGSRAQKSEATGGRVIPAYLDLKNPFEWSEAKPLESFREFVKGLKGVTEKDIVRADARSQMINGFESRVSTVQAVIESVGIDRFTELLKANGYDGVIMDTPSWYGDRTRTKEYVAFDPKQIIGAYTLKQTAGDSYRGKISFDAARSYFKVTLTGKANLSTFLHESGHAFLEFLRMDAQDGHEQSRQDLATLEGWMKGDLETFAKGFEEYLREGKAPSAELRGVFRQISSWLKYVYRAVTGTGVELTDEVRSVMDRMLATDAEIEQARREMGFEPMPPEGMSQGEHAAYLERFGKAMREAQDRAERETLRTTQAALREEHDRAKGEVSEKINADPGVNAWEVLAGRARPDGGEIHENMKGRKLDRAAVEELLGPEAAKRLKEITAEGGMDPDVAAVYLGFSSADELAQALTFASPWQRKKSLREEVNRRMAEKYPGYDGSKDFLRKHAERALHEGEVANVLWAEAQAMAKQAGKESPRTARAVLEGVAKRRAQEMTALEMQPGRFKRAEEQAARRWIEAVKAKDFEAAHAAKMDQLLNHFMWRETDAAREQVEKIAEYGRKGNDLSFRRKLGKAGQNYVEAWDSIAEGVEFDRQTNRALRRRASLESYLKQMEEEDGAVIAIPAELRAGLTLKNYKQMTLEELSTIHAALANVEAMARLKNRLFDGRQRRDFLATATKISEHLRANLGTPFKEKVGEAQNPEWWDRKKAWLRKASAELKKIEFITRAMDGGETAGFAHELLFQPFADAEAKKNRIYREVVGKLMEPMKDLTISERLRYDRMVDFLGTKMRLRDVLAVALNLGNEGNKKKLIEGYAYRRWTEEAVRQRLGELLNEKDLALVNHIWKSVGSLWPEIEALSQRTLGLAPPKVEAVPFEINGVRMEGGYFPIVYDREKGYKAEQIAQRKTGDFFENNFLLPGVSKGFTESRTKFVAPIQLSLSVVPAHLNEVIHYLTHYEAVRSVDRLVANKQVREAITEGMGREVYNLFRPWLQAIAADGTIHEGTTTVDGVFRHLRVGSTLTALGGKVSTALMQALGLTSTLKEIGPKYAAIGFTKFLKEIELSADPFRDANERFDQIRDFEKQMSRELLNDFDNHLSLYADLGHMKDRVGQFSMAMIGLVQKTVNTITAYGAYEKAVAEGHPNPEAYANAVVRFSQMGEGIKDKAAIQRGGELTRTFTMMYSYFSVLYNQLAESAPRNATGKDKIAFHAAKWWWLVILPVAMEAVLRNNGPKNADDPEAWAKTLGGSAAQYVGRTMPILSPVVDTVFDDREPRYMPWVTTMLQAVKSHKKLGEGELSAAEKRAIVDAIGVTAHVPTTAMRNAYLYLDAFTNGSMEEPVQDLLFRSPSKFK